MQAQAHLGVQPCVLDVGHRHAVHQHHASLQQRLNLSILVTELGFRFWLW